MNLKGKTILPLSNLQHLPPFAEYLHTQKLQALAELQLRIAEEINLPLLQFFATLSPPQKLQAMKEQAQTMLTYLRQNRAEEHIEMLIEGWQQNTLQLDRQSITAEDITLVAYMRKKSFLHFLPAYCPDTERAIEIVKEIDAFLLMVQTATANFYITLLKKRIEDHAFFIEQISNTTPGLIYVYDVINHKDLYANRTASKYLGYEPEELNALGANLVPQLVHPDDLLSLKQYESDFETTANGEIRSFKYRMRNYAGEYRWLQTFETVFKRNPDNKITEKIGIAIDVHQQKITADELANSEAELTEAQAIGRLGSFTWHLEERRMQCSAQTLQILESEVFEIDAFFNNIHADDRASAQASFQKALSSGSCQCEYRYNAKGREKILLTRAVVVYENNEPVLLRGTIADVSDQNLLIKKVKEQQHFIEQIADASPTILYLFDVESQSMVYVNREVFFVLGYVPEQITEKQNAVTSQLYHPDDLHLLPCRTESQKFFQQVDSMIQYECRIKSMDGEWHWFLVREIVFKTDEQGNIKQILGAALDINRRKEMEKTILQNTLQLEQSNSSLEEFAYVASHDLKEPLRKISTFGEKLQAGYAKELSGDGTIYLNKIVDASRRMQVMISDLLSISMISGNRSFEPTSVQTIFEETLQTLEYKIEQVNAVITADPLPVANIIPSQFRQLFQNLLSNSLKFVNGKEQPAITISYALLPLKDVVHYQLPQAEQYHKLVFADNGIGFENEFAGKIFTIFQRLHGRSEYEGSGIGLAICKKIVSHHGGIIYAKGEQQKGATFTIILPA